MEETVAIKEELCENESSDHQEAPVPVACYSPLHPVAYNFLRDKLKHTSLPGNFEAHQKSKIIRLNDYYRCGPDLMIQTSVVITPSFETKIRVHQADLPPDHEVWQGAQTQTHTVESVVGLLRRITKYKVCEGSIESDLPDCGPRRQSDTVRCVNCRLFIRQKCCSVCSSYQGLLRKTVKQDCCPLAELPLDTLKLMTNKQLVSLMTSMQQQMKLLLAHSSKLKEVVKHYKSRLERVAFDRVNISLQVEEVKQETVEINPRTKSLEEAQLEKSDETWHEINTGSDGERNVLDEPADGSEQSPNRPPEDTTSLLDIKSELHSDNSDISTNQNVMENDLKISKSSVEGKRKQTQRVYECHSCMVQFANPEKLAKHVKKHTPIFKCQVCDKKFGQLENLGDHFKSHASHGKYGTTTLLDIPPEPRTSLLDIPPEPRTSLLDIPPEPRTSLLDISPKPRTSVLDIPPEPHTSLLDIPPEPHTGLLDNPSEPCSKHQDTATDDNKVPGKDLEVEAETEKNGKPKKLENVYKCHLCNKQFVDPKYLAKHMKKHTLIFKCHVCDKEFSQKCDLSNHCMSHVGQSKCDACGKICSSQQELVKHSTTHMEHRTTHMEHCTTHTEHSTTHMEHSTTHREHGISHMEHSATRTEHRITHREHGTTHMEHSTTDLNKRCDKEPEEKPYMCDVFGKGFRYKQNLSHHKTIHKRQPQSTVYPCDVVQANLPSVEAKEQEPIDSVECEECGIKFPDARSRTRHRAWHEIYSTRQKLNYPKPCDECGKMFLFKQSLYSHKKRHHPGSLVEKKYECPICGHLSGCLSNHKRHQRSIHNTMIDGKDGTTLRARAQVGKEQKKYECPTCWHISGCLSNHRLHQWRIHGTIYDRKDAPGKDGTNTLKAPRQVQTPQKTYYCPTCGHRSGCLSNLKRHQRSKHSGLPKIKDGKPRKPCITNCKECGKGLRGGKTGLMVHMHVHTGEKPYMCHQCGHMCRSRAGLYGHQRTHNKEKLFKCNICGQKLKSMRNLRLHTVLHSKRPSECSTCGKVFLKPGSLRSHRIAHFKK